MQKQNEKLEAEIEKNMNRGASVTEEQTMEEPIWVHGVKLHEVDPKTGDCGFHPMSNMVAMKQEIGPVTSFHLCLCACAFCLEFCPTHCRYHP